MKVEVHIYVAKLSEKLAKEKLALSNLEKY